MNVENNCEIQIKYLGVEITYGFDLNDVYDWDDLKELIENFVREKSKIKGE